MHKHNTATAEAKMLCAELPVTAAFFREAKSTSTKATVILSCLPDLEFLPLL